MAGADSLGPAEVRAVLDGLAAWIDAYPREVFLRGDLVNALTVLVTDAEIHHRHQRHW